MNFKLIVASLISLVAMTDQVNGIGIPRRPCKCNFSDKDKMCSANSFVGVVELQEQIHQTKKQHNIFMSRGMNLFKFYKIKILEAWRTKDAHHLDNITTLKTLVPEAACGVNTPSSNKEFPTKYLITGHPDRSDDTIITVNQCKGFLKTIDKMTDEEIMEKKESLDGCKDTLFTCILK